MRPEEIEIGGLYRLNDPTDAQHGRRVQVVHLRTNGWYEIDGADGANLSWRGTAPAERLDALDD